MVILYLYERNAIICRSFTKYPEFAFIKKI